MGIYVKKSYFHIFSFSSSYQSQFYHIHWFYPHCSFKHKLITSQIRSHIEYLIQSYNILLLILHSKLMKNIALLTVFNVIYWLWLILAYFLGHPVYLILKVKHEALIWQKLLIYYNHKSLMSVMKQIKGEYFTCSKNWRIYLTSISMILLIWIN